MQDYQPIHKKKGYPDPLLYIELIAPKRAVKILSPSEIPVHPAILSSDFAFTPDFIDEVCTSLPGSIKTDVSILEKVLFRKLGIEVSETKVKWLDDDPLDLDEVQVSVKPKSIDVLYGSSNIALDKRDNFKREIQLNGSSHPMRKERLEQYSLSQKELRIPTWYVHNPLDNGFPLHLYFRNFAIMFNNLGLGKLKK